MKSCLPDHGLNPGSLHWVLRVLATGPPGKSLILLPFFSPSYFIFFYLYVFGSVFLSSIFQPVFSQSSVQDTGSGTNLGILSRKEFNIGLRLMKSERFLFQSLHSCDWEVTFATPAAAIVTSWPQEAGNWVLNQGVWLLTFGSKVKFKDKRGFAWLE